MKLHTAHDGIVWFADGNKIPVSSGVKPQLFVERLLQRHGGVHTRLLGSHANAHLITLLRKHSGFIRAVEVASPSICGTAASRATATSALHWMRQCNLPASLGGWHKVNDKDYPAYAMVYQMQTDGCFNDHVQALLRVHPAWYDLQMIQTISAEWTAWVLTFLIDPRWYIDPDNPYRMSRLRAYMGISPKVMSRVMENHDATGAGTRCRAVLGAWYDNGPPTKDRESHPGNFLWRIYRSHGGGLKGLLRASERFLLYLRHTWVQAVYPHQLLFAPELFFKRPEELRAYKRHLANASRSI